MSNAIKSITFNTGRKYTAEGQLVKATLYDDGLVTFHDISRMITGEFELDLDIFSFDQAEVMARYDNHHYKTGTRSWQDGMMRGGRNAR